MCLPKPAPFLFLSYNVMFSQIMWSSRKHLHTKVIPDLHLHVAYSNQRTVGPINIPLVAGKRIFKGILLYTSKAANLVTWPALYLQIFKS